jgi:hypothetical protein
MRGEPTLPPNGGPSPVLADAASLGRFSGLPARAASVAGLFWTCSASVASELPPPPFTAPCMSCQQAGLHPCDTAKSQESPRCGWHVGCI